MKVRYTSEKIVTLGTLQVVGLHGKEEVTFIEVGDSIGFDLPVLFFWFI